MKRLNLTVDENLYEDARKASFITRRPISEILREAMKEWFVNHSLGEKGELLLSKDDETEIIKIINDDEFEDLESVKEEFGLNS
ncbi:MAG: hypothetical protein ISR83_09020 [Candidatus Marinimicrobia bacterium]|nr:hypothetical protein [Candidatus Neomarinimicrobiota bacterium]